MCFVFQFLFLQLTQLWLFASSNWSRVVFKSPVCYFATFEAPFMLFVVFQCTLLTEDMAALGLDWLIEFLLANRTIRILFFFLGLDFIVWLTVTALSSFQSSLLLFALQLIPLCIQLKPGLVVASIVDENTRVTESAEPMLVVVLTSFWVVIHSRCYFSSFHVWHLGPSQSACCLFALQLLFWECEVILVAILTSIQLWIQLTIKYLLWDLLVFQRIFQDVFLFVIDDFKFRCFLDFSYVDDFLLHKCFGHLALNFSRVLADFLSFWSKRRYLRFFVLLFSFFLREVWNAKSLFFLTLFKHVN